MTEREAVESIALLRRMNRAYLFGLLRDNGESVTPLLSSEVIVKSVIVKRPAQVGRERRARKRGADVHL